MTTRSRRGVSRSLGATLVAVVTLAGCGTETPSSILLDGLSQPRGIGVDGETICVAEAGSMPSESPSGERPGQVEADTGRLLCSDNGKSFETVLLGLPFVYYPDAAVTSGAADVVFDEAATYALIGESYGKLSRSVVRVTERGPEIVADLLEFAERRAPADDDGIRSNPWSMVSDRRSEGFLVADAATGQVLSARLDGGIDLFAAVPGHEVLTGMAWGPDGMLYVGSFGQLPHPNGSGAVVAIGEDGSSRTVVEGLTMVIDVGFDRNGGMFILEYSVPPDEPQGVDAYRDDRGRLLYVGEPIHANEPRVLVDGLDRPTALAVRGDEIVVSITGGEQAASEGMLRQYPLDALLAD